MNRFQNKVALVTGSARGIGKAIAQELAAEGAIVIISDIVPELAENTANEFIGKGWQAKAMVADVSKWLQAEALVKAIVDDYGRLDMLVNNAGITRDNLIIRMSEAEWESVIAVNLTGAFNCVKAVARPMMKQRSGRIVNVSSVVGVMGNAGQANYASSKAGMIGLTKSAARELASRNITVNAIAPGYIETDMTHGLSAEAKSAFLNLVPLKRPGTIQDVARVVAFLLSDDASYITGQVIHIDGGMLM